MYVILIHVITLFTYGLSILVFVILCKPYVLFYVKCICYLDKRLYVTKMAYINLLI